MNDNIPYAESFYETTLTNAMTAAQTTMVVATAPTNQSGYLVIEPKSSNREIVKFTSASSTTLTIVRGLSETNNYDDSAGTGKTHAAGVQVAMKDVHYYFNKVVASFRGDAGSGFNSLDVGDGNTISAANRFVTWRTSSLSAFMGLSSSGKFVISEDGSTTYVVSVGGSGVTAGNGIDITASVVTTDLLSTGGLEISAGKNAVALSTGLDRNAGGLLVDQSSAFYWTGLHDFTDISIDGVQVSATAAEINQVLEGVSASVTADALSATVAGVRGIFVGRISDTQDVSSKGMTGFVNTGFSPRVIQFNGSYFDNIATAFIRLSTHGTEAGFRADAPGWYISSGTMYGATIDTEGVRSIGVQTSYIYEHATSAATMFFAVSSVGTSGFTWYTSGDYQVGSGNEVADFIFTAFG